MADGSDQDTLTEGRPPLHEQPVYGDPKDEDAQNLLLLDPKKAAEYVYRLWKTQPKEPRQRRRAEWQVNAWRREGRSNVYVQKTQDQNRWVAWEPPWSVPPVQVLNKADRLCRRLKNIVFADPPEPQAVPSTGEDEDEEAARTSERILMDIQSEANLDDIRTAARAFDRASIYGSGFVRYYIDERGGGRQPVRVMAKPGAVTAEQPFIGPQGEPLGGELISRYVTEAGQLTDEPEEAATRWVPGLKREILHPTAILFMPHDAEDIWDADGIVIATMPTFGELKKLFPEAVEALTEEQREQLFNFKPEQAKDILGLDSQTRRSQNQQNEREDDKRVAVFTCYYKACPQYEDGAYVVALADQLAIVQEPWVYQPEHGDREELEIPVTQYSQYDSGKADPFGTGLMTLLGNGHELRASQVGHMLQYLDQFANRRTFIPTNSIIQPKQYQQMTGTIPINPGGKPEVEEMPPFPTGPMELFTLITEEMDDHSMMQETAQGSEVGTVTSGRQASITIQQAMASLSEIRLNVERGYVRACRIQLQLVRMGYTVPQQISFTGEDGQHRQQWWTGSDLRGTADVRLKAGTLSMMTPEQKMNLAMQFKQMGVYDQNPDLFYEAVTSSLGPVVGLEDDPARTRIKRQLATWYLGPPEGWAPPPPPGAPVGVEALGGLGPALPGGPPPIGLGAPEPAPGPPMDAGAPPVAGPIGPEMGAPMGPEGMGGGPTPMVGAPGPPPVDPTLATIFDPMPADELPDQAMIRLSELKRFMASTRFTRWPMEWRAGVLMEFDRMKLCAGVQTIPDQQAAQQQQMEQQAQAQQQQADQQFQQQLQLEQAKHQGEQANKKPLNLKIVRDPTGRVAEVRDRSAAPAGPAN